MKIRFRPTLTAALLLLLVAGTRAADKPTAFLWKVRSQTTTLYLLGSVHFMKPNAYPLNPVIEEAFAESDRLVVEVNLTAADEAWMKAEVMKRGVYSDGSTIGDHITPKSQALLKSYLSKNHLPVAAFEKFKPGLLAITLSSLQILKLGYSPAHGIDRYFLDKAKDVKPVVELETMAEQLSLFLDAPDEDLLLKQALREMTETEKMMTAIVSAWQKGDAPAMSDYLFGKLLEENPEFLPIYERILYRRNRAMTKKILTFLDSGQTHFVVVGAGHLIGEQGILKELEDLKRYTIEQQ